MPGGGARSRRVVPILMNSAERRPNATRKLALPRRKFCPVRTRTSQCRRTRTPGFVVRGRVFWDMREPACCATVQHFHCRLGRRTAAVTAPVNRHRRHPPHAGVAKRRLVRGAGAKGPQSRDAAADGRRGTYPREISRATLARRPLRRERARPLRKRLRRVEN
jgi:hypothetical protein